MKARWTIGLVVGALALGLVGGYGIAEEGEGGGGMFPTKGEQHEEFKKLEGEWDAVLTYWMGGQPMKGGTDRSTNKVIMNGWYLDQHYKGTMMGSMPWEGRYTLAYDQTKKEYVGYWISSMGGDPSVTRGQTDDSGVLTMYGEMKDSGTQKMRPTVSTYKWTDENTYVFKMHWCTAEKKPLDQVLEITYTRKGAKAAETK